MHIRRETFVHSSMNMDNEFGSVASFNLGGNYSEKWIFKVVKHKSF